MASNTKLTILYGSQTGNAQDVAERIWEDAKRRRLQSQISEMDDFPVAKLPQTPILICVCSTTGQGEEPDNMQKLWRFLLRRNLPNDSLRSTKFAVLGLGDSSYEKFNFAAKKLFRRLSQLGATPILPVGLADDQHDLGYDGVTELWMAQLWTSLGVNEENRISDDILLPPKYKIRWISEQEDSVAAVKNGASAAGESQPYGLENPFLAPLISCERQTAAEHFQDTRLFSLDISNAEFSYRPGDVAMIQPSNLTDSIDKFIELTDLDASILDRKFALESSDDSNIQVPKSGTLPAVTSLRHCAQFYWDLQCVPRRSFFKHLAALATDELEKEKLQEFCLPENQDDLYSYCNRPRRSLVEVLEDFHKTAAEIPLEYYFDLFPVIKPRAFSIASCQEVHGSKLQLLVAVVKYKTKLSIERRGLCSNWLASLDVGSLVPVWIHKGTFKFPQSSQSCLMIGPGTGVAPFRSFIHWRANMDFRKNLLFFGCRNKKADFYFEKEWTELTKNGFLTLIPAFSRDQPDKIYVQDKIRHSAELVAKFLHSENSCVFVAGNANQMPKNVEESLRDVLKAKEGLTEELALERLDSWKRNFRLQFETWS